MKRVEWRCRESRAGVGARGFGITELGGFTEQPHHLAFYFSAAPCADHKQHTGEPACSVTPVMLSWYRHFLPLFVTGKLGQVKTLRVLRGNEPLGDRA